MNLPNSSDGWILGNIQQYGYFRVTYSQDNWDALQRQLMKDHTVCNEINKTPPPNLPIHFGGTI